MSFNPADKLSPDHPDLQPATGGGDVAASEMDTRLASEWFAQRRHDETMSSAPRATRLKSFCVYVTVIEIILYGCPAPTSEWPAIHPELRRVEGNGYAGL